MRWAQNAFPDFTMPRSMGSEITPISQKDCNSNSNKNNNNNKDKKEKFGQHELYFREHVLRAFSRAPLLRSDQTISDRRLRVLMRPQ